jgi:hypothetical protein
LPKNCGALGNRQGERMNNFDEMLRLLASHKVEFIIVGGAAATAHGATRLTEDLDIVYNRTHENIARLIKALENCKPYPRGIPEGLPFQWHEQTMLNGLNFTLIPIPGNLCVECRNELRRNHHRKPG